MTEELEDPVEILLVDDRRENLLTLEAILKSPSYKLIKAESGDQALRYLLENKPALILLDVQMPKLDGYETASLIKGSDRTRDIPIIFLTALYGEDRFIQKGYRTGAVDYVTKPLNSEILKSKVRVFADLHRKTQKLLRFEQEIRRTENAERERKLAEMELKSLRREQAQKRKYQDLVEGIEHGIVWIAEPETKSITYIGPTVDILLGFSHDRCLTEPGFLQRHIHPDDAQAFAVRWQKAIESESEFSMEHRFVTGEGRVLWLQTGARLRSYMDANGWKSEVRGLSVDITKIKEAERTLTKSKLLSDLLAQTSLFLARSTDSNQILARIGKLMVPSFSEWFSIDLSIDGKLQNLGFEFSDDVYSSEGRKVFATNPVDMKQSCDAVAAFESGKPIYHLSLVDKSLEEISGCSKRARLMKTLKSMITVPLLHQGRIFGAMMIASTKKEDAFTPEDINLLTSMACRIATALESLRLYAEAQAAIRIRDEFLSIASHELKTPLTPLKLQIQQVLKTLIRTQEVQPEMITKMLSMSDRQIDRLSRLVEDLLDISHINRGHLQLELESFSLTDLVQDIASRFARQLEEAGCTVNFSLDGPLTVNWDRFRIEQVIVNLLVNAIKYAPGKPVHIRGGQQGSTTFFSVKDHGIGIAPEDQDRIFKRFERAVSRTHFAGLGLGLYIVSQIVERHEGTIHVESQLGTGSNFHVEIPSAGPKKSAMLESVSAPPPFTETSA